MAVDFENSDLYGQMHEVFFGPEKKEKIILIVEDSSLPPSAKYPLTEERLRAAAAKQHEENPLVIKGGIRIERGGHWEGNVGGPGRSYVYPRIK